MMKALRYASQDHPVVDEIEIPEISADEVLIASRVVGVCHSDIELLAGRAIIPFSYPLIPGHEWAGEVAKVGEKVTDFVVGDHVVGECVIGDDHFGCSIDGAAAQYFVVKAEWLHKLPPEMPWTNGALVEPFSVAYYALTRAGNINASDTLVLLGAGPIGLAVTAAAVKMGARTIVADPNPHRRTAALSLGAAHAVAPEELDELLDELTSGRGADVVVEASGQPTVMARALELVAFGGRVAFIGVDVGREASAKLGLIQSKGLKITGSVGSPGVWPETIRFLAQSGIDLSPLVTHRFTIDTALDALDAALHPESTIKAHIELDSPVFG